MNVERINKWIQELRSTEKPQTQSFLQITSKTKLDCPIGFCCVGIACDLAVRGGLEIQVDEHFGEIHYEGNHKTAPDAVNEYYGVNYAFFRLGMYLNDTKMYKFKQIADVYEFLMNNHYTISGGKSYKILEPRELLELYTEAKENSDVK